MATLVLHLPGSPPTPFPLLKPLVSVGAAADSDVRVPHMRGLVAIQFDGRSFTATALEGAPLVVNGRKRDRCALEDGDTLDVSGARLVFEKADREVAPAETSAATARTEATALAVTRLAEFAQALGREPALDRALIRLLDSIVEVVKADKGFVLVVEGGGPPEVLAARNFQQQDIEDAVERLSDSIVRRALDTKQPVIVSDAINDEQFNASESVVNLKLASVMCVPLLLRGEVSGAVYVGNDRLASLFTPRELLLMTSFCSTATLLLEHAKTLDELRADKAELQSRLDAQAYGDIIGACEAMRDIFRKIDKVAATNIDVLVTGESGTGKELIARELHRRSPRKNAPFIAINCGAIPENLLESELFGHAKGAFTGAIAARPGKFQAASSGTLFLDEIGEMPPPLQVKLLRALQERAVTRVGETKSEPVDIRIVSATNKDLEAEMNAGRFREDLYYRVNVVHLHLPPLRERGDDALMLAKFFLTRATRELSAKVKGFSRQALNAIRHFRWPGNIRQLENRIKKAVVLADGPLITPEDMELRPEHLDPILPLAQALENFRNRYINDVLERNGGNRTKTAKDLGVDPRTIFRHLEKEAEERGEALPASSDDALEP
ncbi:MAG: sigma-54-dependent Fis family transcriptional regulator [Deltaproteobacteria bacterium]|nr:MAG: sigma-54-dependent Fis family transcriptional regulator [Deltaproteobacteria bacterium]